MFKNRQLILCTKVHRIHAVPYGQQQLLMIAEKSATVRCQLHGLWVLMMDDDDNDDDDCDEIYIGSVFLNVYNLQVVRSRVQVSSLHGAALPTRCHSACCWSNVATSTAVCIVIHSCGASTTSFNACGQSLRGCWTVDHAHRTVYLSSSLTARHLSPSRNTSRLIYLVYIFRARTDCVKRPCSLGRLRRYNFVKLGLRYILIFWLEVWCSVFKLVRLFVSVSSSMITRQDLQQW